MINTTSRRKIEHLKLCAESPVEARQVSAGFEDVTLIHRALPELNMDELDLSVDFLGKRIKAPFLIASITGGHPDTIPVNAALAAAAEELGVGIGVGSQRAAIDDPSQEDSFRVVRDEAPDAFVYGNVGAAQIRQYGVEGVEKLIEMIDADALAIHLNFLQEAVQPEGDRDATGCLDMITEICSQIKTPVIVKETGAGISREDAILFQKAGVSAIDVGGAGGTSWAGVEVYRAKESRDSVSERLGELFWDFGIPTVASLIESRVSLPLIATGGIRNGLDIAKSIALGASAASAALPFVGPSLEGKESVVRVLSCMLEEFKAAMFLCGCGNIKDLHNSPVVVTGWTREYLEQRGFNVKDLSLPGNAL
ncbi:type 2 isopentenyl-diphosphate Delta-isomerase [Methanosarcina mazei]|uniref:Isopentenyl-diphosphate delta-isomerase n=2 Tax=Methanosarcina mazei TaxID=2209 RepID=IDI2_METMA|nr:type 2 isopentenyl-diphosphate Delta-isomerase [Methanosarcina mazei]Q8PW37.1 RecName: Full=Isopentenyl-diphosphate delta-isomerase; Short=IPP isomerase; AltName: Full=Isopentenyl diphosphate:dimethylallyl diphosphate isomerase; AltName: Full=Isopentenyl pyrophosphate isomerase; AltName: Full=Type 2 isopentenyl diphosphate isomerase; Short=IDI-2 [Methanosarcina mazei Go1]AAM31460.1 Isopentenyl-diphosphate delta-isomerase [Methanosarcina mazei Go1]AKB62761.1 Isopentenyl-diphosphate delta-isome